MLRAPDAAPGDEFGAAVAISDTTEDSQFPGHDLWIGAPGRDVPGRADAGAIYHYAISTAGAITYAGVTTQGAEGEAGDRLGEVLAPIAGGVLAGVPHEDAGTRRNAGGLLLVLSGGGTRSGAGTRAGDRLGTAVADTGLGILAGAPGADVRGHRDAGLVVAYKGTLARRRTYGQGAHGVPGRAEAGDRFGSALATGLGIRCQEEVPIAIGVPGEDVGHARDAGAVTLLGDGDLASCHSRELTQGDGLSGRPHRRARIGATLGIAPDRPGLDDESDALLTGIPAGGILTLRGGYPARTADSPRRATRPVTAACSRCRRESRVDPPPPVRRPGKRTRPGGTAMPRFMMLMYPNITEEQYEEGVRAEDAGAMTKYNEELDPGRRAARARRPAPAVDGRARHASPAASRRSPTARSPRPRRSSAATG